MLVSLAYHFSEFEFLRDLKFYFPPMLHNLLPQIGFVCLSITPTAATPFGCFKWFVSIKCHTHRLHFTLFSIYSFLSLAFLQLSSEASESLISYSQVTEHLIYYHTHFLLHFPTFTQMCTCKNVYVCVYCNILAYYVGIFCYVPAELLGFQV